MDQAPVLRGARVTLRPPRVRDRAERLALGRDPEIVRMFGGDPGGLAPLTATEVDRWYAAACSEPLHWMIEVDGRFTGVVRLHSLHATDRRARFAIGILDPARLGQGIGTETTRLVLRHAFETLRLHRVDLRVLAYNHRAIACYEKCGFVREGIEHDAALIAGAWYDDVLMSILEHEYREAAKRW